MCSGFPAAEIFLIPWVLKSSWYKQAVMAGWRLKMEWSEGKGNEPPSFFILFLLTLFNRMVSLERKGEAI